MATVDVPQLFSVEMVPFWTALAAAAATGTAFVTIAYTYFTLRLVRAQAEPKVILYVKHDFERPSVLLIVIENIGRDIAHDVSFTSSRPIPKSAFGITLEDAKGSEPMADGPLISGIPALGPGDSRTITWGQFGGLTKALGDRPIIVDISYLHGRRRLTGQAKLEVASYLGTDASERPTLLISKTLKEIALDIHRIARGIDVVVAKQLNEEGAKRDNVP